MFYLFLFIGLIIRLVLIPLEGFKADVAYWKGWSLAVGDKGVSWLINNTNYNYPPGFAYILWIVDKIYSIFKNTHNVNEYWLSDNLLYLFLIKLITILADLLVVYLIIKISKKITNNGLRIGKILALFYFLNPATIFDGVVWGQVDQLGFAIFLLSVYLLLIDRPKLASIIFTVSALLKFQNIIFIPLFYLFLFKKYSFRQMVGFIAVSFTIFIVVVFPFFIHHQMDVIIRLLTINADWFPWYSLNAFNGWWIASRLKGMDVVDKQLIFGITSAKQLGLFLFIFAYFIASITLFFSKKEDLFRNFLLACTLAVFAFFHLLTQSHERYLFPVIGLLALIFLFYIKPGLKTEVGSSSKSQVPSSNQFAIFNFQTVWMYLGFGLLVSLFFFSNMYLSMGWNYPDQVYLPFSKEVTLSFSWLISIVQIILFLTFFLWFFSEKIIKYYYLILPFGMLLVTGLLFQNLNYILKKPISLTQIKPVSAGQDYLEYQYNKTVESARGVNYWNRLSVNYYFYEKGIGSHANSEITYHLNKEFSKFSTDFGVDTEGDQSAKVYYSILRDGRLLFKSDIKGRFDAPSLTAVNVKGVNFLTLKITKAGDSIYGAHADWLDPMLIR